MPSVEEQKEEFSRDTGAETGAFQAHPVPPLEAVTLDLREFFGAQQDARMPVVDFQTCFRDAAHGGSGSFERLCVVGQSVWQAGVRTSLARRAPRNADLDLYLLRGE